VGGDLVERIMDKNPPLPPLHDFVRAYEPSLDGTVRRLLDYYERIPGLFNYVPARQVSAAAFAHGVARSQIAAAVTSRGVPSGRKQNLEVAEHVWEAGQDRSVSCYPLSDGRFPIRRDLSIRVPADFLFVENRKPHVFWFQPRRSFALTQLGLGVIASVFRMTFLADDFANAGLELLDLSAPHGVRLHVQYTLESLPLLTDVEVTAVLQQLVQAYDEVCALRRDWGARAERRSRPPMEPGLFG
jgi:hypothetical protein